jgi:hypothetical protein
MKNDYIFVADIDSEYSVRDKKQLLYYRFSYIDGANVVIVIKEIESWYYAGISGSLAQELGVTDLQSTNEMTKEDFNARIPRRYDSRIDFMFEILKSFSFETAAHKNTSFHFFVDRYRIYENPAM